MRKVKLDLHDLQVETFHTSPMEPEPGTVGAYESAPRPCRLETNHDTCNNSHDYCTCSCEVTLCEQTYVDTCLNTCAGDTCGDTCHTFICACNLSDFGTCIC
jgi:hypothetical protein